MLAMLLRHLLSSTQSFSRGGFPSAVTAYVFHRTRRRPMAVIRNSQQESSVKMLFGTTSTGVSSLTEAFNATASPEAAAPPHKSDDTEKSLLENWREHPDLNPTIHFPSWAVPVGVKSIQTILSAPILQPYLASRLDLLEHMHMRLKLVRDMPPVDDDDDDDDKSKGEEQAKKKLILLHPDTPSQRLSDFPPDVQDLLRDCHVEPGPEQTISFSYRQFTASYILTKLLPESAQPPPTAFETIGHVAHLNLRPCHLPYRHSIIGPVLLETLPQIETVIHKVADVAGPYRTYEFEVLAGRLDTAVHVHESGISLRFNVADVYWCSRLSQERQRLVRDEFIGRPGHQIIIADAFCGVGALCLQAAKQHGPNGCTIWANDWNPAAVDSLRQNAIANGVHLERVVCGDAYDFLMDVGLMLQTASSSSSSSNTVNDDDNNDDDGKAATGDGAKQSPKRRRLPDHVVLNFPLQAPSFLGALRWWPAAASGGDTTATTQRQSARRRQRRSTTASSGKDASSSSSRTPKQVTTADGGEVCHPRIHVYTFARADPDTDRSAQDVAVDLVASNLLPPLGGGDDSSSRTNNNSAIRRLSELNDEYGCRVHVHHVRDVAPGKLVLCVSFTATPKLLRHMQGDFS